MMEPNITAELTKTVVGEWLRVTLGPVEARGVAGRRREDVGGVGRPVAAVVRRLTVVGVGRAKAVVRLSWAL